MTVWIWEFTARWWQLVAEGGDFETGRGMLALDAGQMVTVEVWETHETIEDPTPEGARARFEKAYPWIEHFNFTAVGTVKPKPKKKQRTRNKRP